MGLNRYGGSGSDWSCFIHVQVQLQVQVSVKVTQVVPWVYLWLLALVLCSNSEGVDRYFTAGTMNESMKMKMRMRTKLQVFQWIRLHCFWSMREFFVFAYLCVLDIWYLMSTLWILVATIWYGRRKMVCPGLWVIRRLGRWLGCA